MDAAGQTLQPPLPPLPPRSWPLGCRLFTSACPPPPTNIPSLSAGHQADPTNFNNQLCCSAGGEEELRAKLTDQPPPQTAYRPRLGNIAPRVQDWEPRRGNTQTPPLTGPVRAGLAARTMRAGSLPSAHVQDMLLSSMRPRSCRPPAMCAEQASEADAAPATGATVSGAPSSNPLKTLSLGPGNGMVLRIP